MPCFARAVLPHVTALALLALVGWSAPAAAGAWPVPDDTPGTWDRRDGDLEILDVLVGEGPEAVQGAQVEVHYTGMLSSGQVFDTSLARGTPLSFRIGKGRVIQGWERGVQGMRVGGKRRLIIPPALGYGERASGPIPPGSTLYFEVELVRIVDAPPPLADAPRPVDPGAFKTTRSGLAWADVTRGSGGKPKSDRRVCVSYTAWSGGERIDDTRAKGGCWWFRYDHDAVFEGLTEGLRKMKQGGVRQLSVPPELLGGRGPNGPITSKGPVLFEVELVEVTE